MKLNFLRQGIAGNFLLLAQRIAFALDDQGRGFNCRVLAEPPSPHHATCDSTNCLWSQSCRTTDTANHGHCVQGQYRVAASVRDPYPANRIVGGGWVSLLRRSR